MIPRIRELTAAACLGLMLAGCQSTGQILDDEQGAAVDTAVRRGQFDLGCPAATGEMLTRTLLQPIAWRGIERAEYTVGVEGCGKRASYVTVCPLDSSACMAVRSGGG